MSHQLKMSLIAEFDDLCRATLPLTEAYEDDLIKFCKNQERNRQLWLAAEIEQKHSQALYQKLMAENRALEANLTHARNAIELEMKKRIAAEHDRDALERQIALIRELLLTDRNAINDETREKLAFLNGSVQIGPVQESSPRRLDTINESTGSILSSEDFSYDKTDENLDNVEVGFVKTRRQANPEGKSGGRSMEGRLSEGRRRPSAPPLPKELTPPKRSKGNESGGKTTVSWGSHIVTTNAVIESSNIENVDCNKKTSFDGDSLLSKAYFQVRSDNDSITTVREPHTPFNNWTPLRSFSSASKIGNRSHDFCTKTIIKPEMCFPCGKRIKFGKNALKCKDCRAVCHPDCKDKVPLPCIPVVNTPTSKGNQMGTIADYTPYTIPMVPAIIIHCVNEVETRGLEELGIYRVPGSEREVKELKEKFLRGKGVPNLSKIDVHVICGCIKDFLRSLKEPLITNTLWKDFVRASEMPDPQDGLTAIYQAISELPQPNRDTLAYMILHLQRVAECPDCRMPATNLAKIFGPTIVGYSSLDPEPAMMLTETKKQAAVMECLLKISSDYWNNFVKVDLDLEMPLFETPDIFDGRRVSNEKRTSLSSRKGFITHTPLKARDSTKKASKHSRRSANYFTSPMLK